MSIKYKEHLEVKFYDLLEKIVKDGDSLKVTIKKAKNLENVVTNISLKNIEWLM